MCLLLIGSAVWAEEAPDVAAGGDAEVVAAPLVPLHFDPGETADMPGPDGRAGVWLSDASLERMQLWQIELDLARRLQALDAEEAVLDERDAELVAEKIRLQQQWVELEKRRAEIAVLEKENAKRDARHSKRMMVVSQIGMVLALLVGL